MSYNGSGTFLINSAGQPVVANTVISATVFNALTSDLATGLSTAITKDGQTTITNNIPFGSNKITGLGSGTAAADAANLGQVQSTVAKLITVTGTDTITGSMSPQLTAYAAGQLFYFVANAANTGAVTLNIDSLGAKNITRDGSSALAAGDINSGEVVVVIYDGTRFQMINAANSFGNTTINGTLTVTGNAGFQANVSITSALSVGGVFAVTGAATFTANPTLSAGTANGVLYLNGSKVATSGSALTFDGTNLTATRALKAASNSPAVGSFVDGLSVGGYDSIGFAASPATALAIGGYRTSQWSGLEFYTSGSLQATLTSTGLGIGTASPSDILTLTGGASGSYGVTINNAKEGGGTKAIFQYDRDNALAVVGANTTNGLVFKTLTGGSLTTKATIDASGNLGLGVTPSAWNSVYRAFNIGLRGFVYSRTDNDETSLGVNWYRDSGAAYKYSANGYATSYLQSSGGHYWYNSTNNTSGAGASLSLIQAMTLDASGNLLVGTTSSTLGRLEVVGGTGIRVNEDAAGTKVIQVRSAFAGGDPAINVSTNHALAFNTNNTERARITAGGDLQFATTNASPVTNNVAGIVFQSAGVGQFSSDGNPGIQVNRKTNDGDLVVFRQDGTQEGSISVSGNTVSYNAFAGSHWSQLQDGSKPDILRGTVMESINELCVWPGEQNERLPKSKVSDTAGSKKVYGVFMAWDNDWTETNDMYVTAVGAFICRVNGSVTVQEGDLLESNGDGTARVQADDIIRSSTIGKVTSTVKTHQYDDGSYCVPTVLYCG